MQSPQQQLHAPALQVRRFLLANDCNHKIEKWGRQAQIVSNRKTFGLTQNIKPLKIINFNRTA
jgi:hypothetical protein